MPKNVMYKKCPRCGKDKRFHDKRTALRAGWSMHAKRWHCPWCTKQLSALWAPTQVPR